VAWWLLVSDHVRVPEPTTIACDESGSEGENLTGSASSVFVHASVSLPKDVAAAGLHELRCLAPSQAAEFKSKQLLANHDALLWFLGSDGPLMGKASAFLVDKDYFVVGKVVDLLVEELAHARGQDIYEGGEARDMAWALYREGRRAFGQAKFASLLSAFNSLMRTTQRSGDKTTVDAFFQVVDEVRLGSTRRNVSEVLALIWQARPHAEEFQAKLIAGPRTLPALDPLVAALPQTIRTWAERTAGPVKVVHDEQALLTPSRVQELVQSLAHPHPDFQHMAAPVSVLSFDLARSHEDPRIMLADLLAGAARVIATDALRGHPDVEVVAAINPYVDVRSSWADVPSWQLLSGRATPGS